MINPNLLSLLTQLNQQPQRLGQGLLGGGLPDVQMPQMTMPSATSLLGMGDLPKPQPAVRMPFESGVPQLQTPVVEEGAGVDLGGDGLFSALGQGIKSKIADPDYMLALGTSLLQGPSRTPIKFGQSLGQGLLAGQQAQKEREQEALASLLNQAEIASKLKDTSGFKDETTLRKEYTALSKDFVEALSGYQKVKAAGLKANPSGADDVALIFGFMKTLDPGSVVREGEFATAKNTAGVPERFRALYNSMINGDQLSDTQRKKLVAAAQSQIQSILKAQQLQEQRYKSLAGQYGFSQERVVDPYSDQLELLPEEEIARYGQLTEGDIQYELGVNIGIESNPVVLAQGEDADEKFGGRKGIHYIIVGDNGKTKRGVTD